MLKSDLTWDSAPEILTVREAASLVRLPRNAVYEAIRAGLLPAANFGTRRIRIAKAALREVFYRRLEHLAATAAFSHAPGGEN